MLRIEIGKKLSVLPLKTLQPTKIHNKSKISLIDFLEKLRGIKPIFTHFSGHFGLQDGRRGSQIFFFAIFQLSSSRPFIWYQICTENPVIRKKVSKPPYPPLTSSKLCASINKRIQHTLFEVRFYQLDNTLQ